MLVREDGGFRIGAAVSGACAAFVCWCYLRWQWWRGAGLSPPAAGAVGAGGAAGVAGAPGSAVSAGNGAGFSVPAGADGCGSGGAGGAPLADTAGATVVGSGSADILVHRGLMVVPGAVAGAGHDGDVCVLVVPVLLVMLVL